MQSYKHKIHKFDLTFNLEYTDLSFVNLFKLPFGIGFNNCTFIDTLVNEMI